MAKRICIGCGGHVGVDCFNPSECEWIAWDQERRHQEQQQQQLEELRKENEDIKKRLLELEAKQPAKNEH